MFTLFSRSLFFLVFLFSFLFLLTLSIQAQTSNPPSAPGKPTVTGGNQQVTLTASVSDNGGSEITGWEYRQKADGGNYGSWTQINNSSSGNSLSGTVTGLQNGTTYRFKVRAENDQHYSAESPESDAVTLATTPSAPGKPTVTGGNQQVTLAASVSDNGGSAVTGWKYQQKVDGGDYGSWTQISNSSSGNSLSGTVTGLQNGTAYRFKVRAVNGNGDGAESPESDVVTPAACASSLTGVKASGAFVDYGLWNRHFEIKISWDEIPNAVYTVIWENSQNLPYAAGSFGPADKSYYEIDGNKIFYRIHGQNSDDGHRRVTYRVSVTAIVDGCEDVSYGPVTVSTGGGSRNNVPASSAPDGGGNSDDTCPGYNPVVTAQDVERLKDPETLATFVKEARAGVELLLDGETDQEEAMRKLAECFGAEGGWNHGSTYLFSIADDGRYFLAPGETGPAGTYLDLVDENGCDVAAEIIRAARGETLLCDDLGLLPEGDAGGFVQYLWDSPADSADDSDAGNEALGSSPKLSYVEGITNEELLPGGLIILGSGYYPEISVPEPGGETSGSGGGCALVAETDARNGAAMGLFLSALALGCAVFLGRGVFPRRG